MVAIYEYRYSRHKIAEPPGTVRSPADVAAVPCECVPPSSAETEQFVLAVLDTQNAIIRTESLYVGYVAGSPVRVSEVFRTAVRLNATSIVVAHNHPSGDPTPSDADIEITRELARAGRILDIGVLDHVVLGSDGRSASLRALGYLEV